MTRTTPPAAMTGLLLSRTAVASRISASRSRIVSASIEQK